MRRDYKDMTYDERPRGPISMKAMIVIAIVGSLSVFVGLKIMSQNTLPIKSVQIGGAFHYVKPDAIKKQVAPLIKGNFLTIDIKKIHQAVENNEWLEHVSIRRIWPDTLRIYVIERTPVARWNRGKLLSEKGDIFDGASNPKVPRLPLFTGPDDQAKLIAKRFGILKKFFIQYNLNVKRISVDNRHAWQVELDNRVVIKLGRVDIALRLQRLQKVYGSVLSDKINQIAVIDLRYTNGFAIKWRKGNKSKKVAFGS